MIPQKQPAAAQPIKPPHVSADSIPVPEDTVPEDIVPKSSPDARGSAEFGPKSQVSCGEHSKRKPVDTEEILAAAQAQDWKWTVKLFRDGYRWLQIQAIRRISDERVAAEPQD